MPGLQSLSKLQVSKKKNVSTFFQILPTKSQLIIPFFFLNKAQWVLSLYDSKCVCGRIHQIPRAISEHGTLF